jgi:hypothetical protein
MPLADFVWDPRTNSWMDSFGRLKGFKATSRPCDVPRSYPQDMKFSCWVEDQRRLYMNKDLYSWQNSAE